MVQSKKNKILEENQPLGDNQTQTTTTDGGSSTITVTKAPEATTAEELGNEPSGEAAAPVNLALNEAMIESLCLVVGNVLVLVTGVDEMAFDESEVEQLKSVWGGLLPETSPLVTAVICTLIIVGGKFTIYATLKKDKKVKGDAEKTAQKALGKPADSISGKID